MIPSHPVGFTHKEELAKLVTASGLEDEPACRWFYFPNSFSPRLVHTLIDEWQLPRSAILIDPFVGAGSTLCAAKSRNMSAFGLDISPLSVFVSNCKVADYSAVEVSKALADVREATNHRSSDNVDRSTRLARAFSDEEFAVLVALRNSIQELKEPTRDLMLLALLRTQQAFSRAVPNGGWFRWVEKPSRPTEIWPSFENQVREMLIDIEQNEKPSTSFQKAYEGDARSLSHIVDFEPSLASGCQAIITSPPYPNRHDYTRVFQIELLTLGLDDEKIRLLRKRSLRSHVEAKAPKEPIEFEPSPTLQRCLDELPEKTDKRVTQMLRSYFEDMAEVLRGCFAVLSAKGKVALVVGNVRYSGIVIPVDEILVEMAPSVGFTHIKSWVARLRGNSAQQMGRYGRVPNRESIVQLEKAM